ncbi:MAG TPA: hypothetical protein VE130_17305 [Nitrososphaeraceae archaeon]|nr:hypothetical protein [Nitrososphaeraceae archaeon]
MKSFDVANDTNVLLLDVAGGLQRSVIVSYMLVIVSIALSGYLSLERGGISFNSVVPSASSTSEGDNKGENTSDSGGNEVSRGTGGDVDAGGERTRDDEGSGETGGDIGEENTDTDTEPEAPVVTDQLELLTIGICDNGADDDGDGQIDFNDTECKSNNALPSIAPIFSHNTTTTTPPSGPGVPEICGDGIDNNGFDGIDEGCLGLQNRFPGDVSGVLAPEGTEGPNGW